VADGLCEVLMPGVASTVQDLPGRPGYAAYGVPAGGAWDDLSLALANIAVGNHPGAAGLEAVLRGPVLRMRRPATICVTGAASEPLLDGAALPLGQPVEVFAGQHLDIGPVRGAGLRSYLAVRGGLAVPDALDSRSTFVPGRLGGYQGRALRAGDVLSAGEVAVAGPVAVSEAMPVLTDSWTLRVIPGPHTFLADLVFETRWRIDEGSGRSGIRLAGPDGDWWSTAGRYEPEETPCPAGGVLVEGGTPVIAGPDGPCAGGSTLLAVVISADRWRLAQCRPGDRVRLLPVTPEQARAAALARDELLAGLTSAGRDAVGAPQRLASYGRAPGMPPAPLRESPGDAARPGLVIRRAGDRHLLLQLGPPQPGAETSELLSRIRVHLFGRALAKLPGVAEVVPGSRSVLLAAPDQALAGLAGRALALWHELPDPAGALLTVREVALPLAFDHPALGEAVRRYQSEVRAAAPWCPDNVEYLRSCNNLGSRDEVLARVAGTAWLVLGFAGAVPGSPVAVPLEPAGRLTAPRYDPGRAWTPGGAVGLVGGRLHIHATDGPGDSQLVGRTVPVWRDVRPPLGGDQPAAPAGPPWLLRPFDVLRFHPVDAAELADRAAALAAGAPLTSAPATLRVSDLLGDPAAAPLPA
jgi:urea carboxylase